MRNVFFLLVLVNLGYAAWHSWYSPARVPHSVDTDLPKLTLVSELPPEMADRRKANAAAPDVHLPEEVAVGGAPPSPSLLARANSRRPTSQNRRANLSRVRPVGRSFNFATRSLSRRNGAICRHKQVQLVASATFAASRPASTRSSQSNGVSPGRLR